MDNHQRTYPLLSACGLNCGLCPRYHTNGASKCPGCGGEGFYTKRPPCAVTSCCRRRSIEYCYECDEYPCKRHDIASIRDSFITHRNRLKDIAKIKNHGLAAYQSELNQKVEILRYLLENYNDGRRKSFFCIAVNLLELEDIKEVMSNLKLPSLAETGRRRGHAVAPTNLTIKEKSQIAVQLFQDMAVKRNVELKLKK